MQAFWNERYAQSEYAYGEVPNQFFQDQLPKPFGEGQALFPGEGEGRNAVYAAQRGWTVCAFDLSARGQEKALQLATQRQVDLRYEVANVLEYEFPEMEYDLIGLFFVHLPPELRQLLHQKTVTALRTGGMVILEAFHPRQLGLDSGGPKRTDMLYSTENLREDFSKLDIQQLQHTVGYLREGRYHQGEAQLTRMIAKKT